jgi:putative ATP-dependent endonuclease of the OLD family
MKLRAVGIWNHSRLQDVEVEVRQHLVLVGPNDVGKSSLIRYLDFLLGASAAQLYARLGSADFRDPDKPLVFEAVLDGLDEQDRALFPDEITVDPATDAIADASTGSHDRPEWSARHPARQSGEWHLPAALA